MSVLYEFGVTHENGPQVTRPAHVCGTVGWAPRTSVPPPQGPAHFTHDCRVKRGRRVFVIPQTTGQTFLSVPDDDKRHSAANLRARLLAAGTRQSARSRVIETTCITDGPARTGRVDGGRTRRRTIADESWRRDTVVAHSTAALPPLRRSFVGSLVIETVR